MHSFERLFRSLREHGVKRVMAMFLIVVLSVVIVISAPGIILLIRDELLADPKWVIDTAKIPVILDLVLWVLITIELMDSIRIYIARHVLHLETVLSLAMIALARKIITLKLGAYEPLTIVGVAALVIGTALAYYFVRRSHKECGMQGIHGFDDDD